jgi:TonB-linked outer membrane protein, SusC/RagA family/TonB-dependent outer membrane receptor, SusC/RagA subfamily, signature region
MKKVITLFAIAMLSVTAAFAQYRASGVVVDKDGIPVIGAAVVQQGTTVGVQTGLDGDWTLNVPSADTPLEISFLGYKTVVVPASQASRLVLQDDAEFLDEVVVIGYGSVKKSDMTGSVVALKADEINRGAVNSPEQMLLGKVSGLHITPATGQPGASAKIRIRGAASLNASNDPLIVIDGVPVTSDGGAGMGNPLASVNPNDIESYSVLKDASATAIYGSRASNGVIIITTKKGVGNGINISYNGSTSVKQNVNTIQMMTGDEFRSFISSTYGSGDPRMALLGNANTDWQKEIYRLAVNTDHNVSVYGGGKFPFRASVGYNLDQATLKTGDNQRGNLDLSISPKFFDDHLSVTANVKGIYQKTNWANSGAIGNALAFNPTVPVMDGNQYWNWYSNGEPNTMASTNPLSTLYEWNDYGHTLRSIGNLQLDYKFHGFEDLRANVNLGYDVAQTKGEKFNELGSFLARSSSLDLATQYKNFNANTLLEAYLDYSHEFSKSNLDVMAGYSWQHNYVKYDNTDFYNKDPRFQSGDLYYQAPSNAKEYFLVSFFGRINYSIMSKYLFTFTAREDASSRFSKANRWGFFPSAAFAWNIGNEDWLKSSKAVSQLKLRLGWGRTGQQDIGSDYYPYLARYIESDALELRYNMGDGNYTTLGPQAYNPNLKWETTETYNVGLDFGFISDRITGTIEAYYRNTYDLLNQVSTPLGSNFSNVVMSNIGNMVNRGIETSLNFVPVETTDWHWSFGGNMTFQDTKITKLTEQNLAGYLGVTTGSGMGGTGGYTSLHRIGYAPYTFYMFQQLYDANGVPVENGLVDRDHDGVITDSDRYVTGLSNTPWMFFGLNTRLSYKNWDFSINAHGSVGNYLINKNWMGYCSSYSDDYNKGYINNYSSQYLIPGWTAAMINNQKYSDLFIENASFFKIDDINLGYTFKIDKFIKDLRVAASVQNVYTFTNYTGLDPEIGSSDGVDGTIIPRPRLYTIRLSINF